MRAAAALGAARRETVETGGGEIRVRLSPGADADADAGAINAALVNAGVTVFRIAPATRRLEDVYMRHAGAHATGGGDAHPPV